MSFGDKAMKVSIVLGAYNGERFIGEQIESLLNQSYRPYEIIVADDRSQDNTVGLVEEIAKHTDIPIRVYVNDRNLGFAENFLVASSRASGELVAFCDQDDVWNPRKLEVCVRAFNPDVVLVVHTARLIDQNGMVIGDFTQGIEQNSTRPPLSYDPWGVFFGFSMIFRRTLLDVVSYDQRGVDYISGKPGLAHDRWILYLANMMGSTVEIKEPLVDYRQHGKNLFGAAKQSTLRERAGLILTESARYVQSAREQRELIEAMGEEAARQFPQFDRAAASRFWAEAERRQLARAKVYHAKGRLRASLLLVRNIVSGVYTGVHSAKFRMRSMLKDAAYIATAPAANAKAGKGASGPGEMPV